MYVSQNLNTLFVKCFEMTCCELALILKSNTLWHLWLNTVYEYSNLTLKDCLLTGETNTLYL